jgi:hypothetical protein
MATKMNILFLIIAIIVIILSFYNIKLSKNKNLKPQNIQFIQTDKSSQSEIKVIKKFKIDSNINEPVIVLYPNIELVILKFKKDNEHYLQINDKIFEPYDNIYVFDEDFYVDEYPIYNCYVTKNKKILCSSKR